ncbi:hypothetical protein KXS11_17785 [Plantibacter flavus]|uniref:hypothetical protein n=1 Tax=Plantibacter flavus TaxID=150123 RepID=UPI003F17B484
MKKTRSAWVITWSHTQGHASSNWPTTPPGSTLAVFPQDTPAKVIEGALLGLYQAFTSEYPSDLFPYVRIKGHPAPYLPHWNWNGTHCSIGHDIEVMAHRVKDFELDPEGAGVLRWSVTPAGTPPVING